MTVVYLSGSRLQAVRTAGGSSAGVAAVANTDIRRCMLGGSVTDKPLFCQLLQQLLADGFETKSVRLVLNCPQLLLKELQVPLQKPADTARYIAQELAPVDREGDSVRSYLVLRQNRKTRLCRVLACSADAAYIKELVQLFAQCGIGVSSIEPALFCAVRALRGMLPRQGGSLVQIMEEDGFTSVLMQGDDYAYSTYNRLVSAHGTPELGSEVARSVSAITQFAKAQQLHAGISQVFLAGCGEEDREIICDAVDRMGGMGATAMLPDNPTLRVQAGHDRFSDCVFACGALLPRPREADLLQALARLEHPARTLSGFGRAVLGLAALFVVMASLSVGVSVVRNQKRAQVQQVQAYLQSDQVLQQVEYADTLSGELGRVRGKINGLQQAKDVLSTYPVPDSRVNLALQSCAQGLVQAQIMQYDSATGRLTLNTLADEVDKISDFIAALDAGQDFQVEEYTGYEYMEETGKWSVDVVVRLAAQTDTQQP